METKDLDILTVHFSFPEYLAWYLNKITVSFAEYLVIHFLFQPTLMHPKIPHMATLLRH